MSTKQRRALTALFIVYCAVMLWLLFVQDRGGIQGDYWEQIRRHIHLKPFAVIKMFIRMLRSPASSAYYWLAFRNLFGNVVLFFPIGWFLPLLYPRLHRWYALLAATVAIILTIELTQLFTWRGYCDVDDLILNSIGAMMGYGLLLIWEKIRRKVQE